MKKLFAPTWLTAWVTGLLPDHLFFLGRKTPWYRRGLRDYGFWAAGALIAPFALFLLWKGIAALRGSTGTEQ